MALTKVNNRMVDGAVFNVLNFGADPTGVADIGDGTADFKVSFFYQVA